MARKRGLWIVMLCVLYTGIMGAALCGKNAKNQIDTAKSAVEEARGAQAPTYAPQEFRSAEESLLLAQQQYDKRKYKNAESSAKTAEDQAKLALKMALEYKAKKDEERKRQEEEEARLRQLSSLYSDTVQPSGDQASLALKDIHFDYDAAGLSDEALELVKLNAQWLISHPEVKVEIEGHCDERGSEEYNLALGSKRAKTVYDMLVDQGVDASRLRTISYGESVPLDPGHGEDAWSKNRRVHFAVIQ